MFYTVTITSQGQISIPAKVRRQVGFSKKAVLSVEKDHIVLKPAPDIFDLMGSLKTNKHPLTNKELHDLFGEAVAKDEV